MTCCLAPASPRSVLHSGVMPEGCLATLDNAFGWHARFTLSQAGACELIDQVWRVVHQWREYFEDFGVATEQRDRVAAALRQVDDVSTPALRKLLP